MNDYFPMYYTSVCGEAVFNNVKLPLSPTYISVNVKVLNKKELTSVLKNYGLLKRSVVLPEFSSLNLDLLSSKQLELFIFHFKHVIYGKIHN